MTNDEDTNYRFVDAIRETGLSIYDPIEEGDPKLWIPTPELEELLSKSLEGFSLAGLPLRTRSKVVKEQVCKALGYRVPRSFKKTQPRFPGQQFDTYAQKSLNLQIWNEGLSATRRYVIIGVDEDDCISKVKVVNGEELAKLDTTGTLTQKYQARLVASDQECELIVGQDTHRIAPHVHEDLCLTYLAKPTDHPKSGQLLPILDLFNRLKQLVGVRFADKGYDQERNRGAALHELVCKTLGYADYGDNGKFPDIRHQLLEVKLQTAPTIDLGLVCPDSQNALDIPRLNETIVQLRDVRYAVFYGTTDGQEVTITHFFLTSGEHFFTRFPKFGGNVLNKKLQIPLPKDFFS